MKAEQPMQPKFRIQGFFGCLILLAAIIMFSDLLFFVPNRSELGWRTARIDFRPVDFDASRFGPLRLAGAFKLTSSDERFGGVSALAIDRGQLLALTDSGVLIRFNRPTDGQRAHSASATIGELGTGPGDPRFKRNRDTEALLRDPGGRGWWVIFENRHDLILFDPGFRRILHSISLRRYHWRPNVGVEGAVWQGAGMLLFHESGGKVVEVNGSRQRLLRLAGAGGGISDAAILDPGKVIVIERRQTLLGFRNSLVEVERNGSGFRLGRRIALPLGPVDNLEAVAVETRPNGSHRLWLMTDDNLQPPLRTLLIALDWPASPLLKQSPRESPEPAPTAKH
jgi:hypothetical protein